MDLTTKILLVPCIYVVSYLPWRILDGMSAIIYVFLFYIVRYRKKVVREHIQYAFPNLDSSEREAIVKNFYKHLADIIVETIKGFSMSEKDILKHFQIKENQAWQDILQQDKNIIVALSHQNNWEWVCLLFGAYFKDKRIYPIGFYKPLRNKSVEQLLNKMRTKFGGTMYSSEQPLAVLRRLKQKEQKVLLGSVSDQRPLEIDKECVLPFLNRLTPFFTGLAWLSMGANVPIYYGSIRKVKRHYYQIEFIHLYSPTKTIIDKKQETQYIMKLYAHQLEKDIQREPHTWLWSHKRWKFAPMPYNSSLNTSALTSS
ncbi:MAG: lysophospholipid acyltransferase family protein [Bacteroidia bacterium]|nr:lysophospholipid acyltransferase family protein [Bacteroidia bacterium]MDW8302424.1 lysophospholipid acyltransferase family protein [Bacteroidia bacterium]